MNEWECKKGQHSFIGAVVSVMVACVSSGVNVWNLETNDECENDYFHIKIKYFCLGFWYMFLDCDIT